MPAAVEVSEPIAVTLLPEIPPMAEYTPLPGAEGEKAADTERTESAVAAEAGTVLSNYWDFVRAEIAACVRYPRDAVRQGIEGTVDLRLTLDAKGGLLAAVPLRETPTLLVRPAVSAAYRAAPFPPNPNRSCEVVSVILPVHFRLNSKQERNSLE